MFRRNFETVPENILKHRKKKKKNIPKKIQVALSTYRLSKTKGIVLHSIAKAIFVCKIKMA